jgi:hypothetical protein
MVEAKSNDSSSNSNSNNYTILINNIEINIEEFKLFLLGKIKVDHYRFKH